MRCVNSCSVTQGLETLLNEVFNKDKSDVSVPAPVYFQNNRELNTIWNVG
jgi:hypothetical protein